MEAVSKNNQYLEFVVSFSSYFINYYLRQCVFSITILYMKILP